MDEQGAVPTDGPERASDADAGEAGDGATVVRSVDLPVDGEEAWDALTDEARMGAWFGADVAWDLRPGGPARFVETDGRIRVGEVDEVVPGRRLRFRWWPAAPGDGTAGSAASAVTYELEPVGDGTRLVVTETRLPSTSTGATARAEASAAAGGLDLDHVVAWDLRLVGLWAGCHARLPVRA